MGAVWAPNQERLQTRGSGTKTPKDWTWLHEPLWTSKMVMPKGSRKRFSSN